MKHNLEKNKTVSNEEESKFKLKDDNLVAATKKKDIHLYSFNNMRERFAFREQRANKIKMRSEEIKKELEKKSKILFK